MIAQKRHLDIERFHAKMPDGRILLIERTHDLGLAPRLQSLISFYSVPLVLILAVFAGPFIPAVMFAGFESYILFVFASVTMSAIAQNKLIDWMQNFDLQPDTCEVIGMDCSTEELFDFYRDAQLSTPTEERIH
nr:hypothetical protein [Hyphomonas sp. Mor2]